VTVEIDIGYGLVQGIDCFVECPSPLSRGGGARLRHVARSALEAEVQARRLATWISICSGTYEAVPNEMSRGRFDMMLRVV
jgi:hypothetical protein